MFFELRIKNDKLGNDNIKGNIKKSAKTGGLVLHNILVDCLLTHFDTVGLKLVADLLRAVHTTST